MGCFLSRYITTLLPSPGILINFTNKLFPAAFLEGCLCELVELWKQVCVGIVCVRVYGYIHLNFISDKKCFYT